MPEAVQLGDCTEYGREDRNAKTELSPPLLMDRTVLQSGRRSANQSLHRAVASMEYESLVASQVVDHKEREMA